MYLHEKVHFFLFVGNTCFNFVILAKHYLNRAKKRKFQLSFVNLGPEKEQKYVVETNNVCIRKRIKDTLCIVY
uniref:Putative ovule protein n=2 Tax=Solanum chacoense TaxID=4108 RepID=A0A0V0GV88_SOLCH